MRTAVRDQAGNAIDAHFEVEDGAIIFHSRGGAKGAPNVRNTQYREGLRLILGRLIAASAPIKGIWADSNRVQRLPLNQRIIVSREEMTLGIEQLLLLASRRMQNVGSINDDSVRGNSNKRLRIGLEGNLGGAEILKIISGPQPIPGSTAAEPLPAPEASDAPAVYDTSPRRVWATSFWGFNPEEDGYFGFTREGDREWFLSRAITAGTVTGSIICRDRPITTRPCPRNSSVLKMLHKGRAIVRRGSDRKVRSDGHRRVNPLP